MGQRFSVRFPETIFWAREQVSARGLSDSLGLGITQGLSRESCRVKLLLAVVPHSYRGGVPGELL